MNKTREIYKINGNNSIMINKTPLDEQGNFCKDVSDYILDKDPSWYQAEDNSLWVTEQDYLTHLEIVKQEEIKSIESQLRNISIEIDKGNELGHDVTDLQTKFDELETKRQDLLSQQKN